MDYFCTLVFLLGLISDLRGELSLEIVKNVTGTEVPVSEDTVEFAGKNVTLTCKLVPPINYTSAYFDDELSWGWKHTNVQFNNAADLEDLARDNPKLFSQFLDKSAGDHVVKKFHPLMPLDSGIYFCMSLKYKLFKILKLEVTVGSTPDELFAHFRSMNKAAADRKGPLIYPKFLCTEDKFICKSGAPCFSYEYVCDNVQDCEDGSDESVELCGTDPCADKKQCFSGRCISESLCCNKRCDPDCPVDVKPSCCNEILVDPDEVSIIYPDDVDYTNDFTDNVHWSTYEAESVKFKCIWIGIPCIIILVLVAICIILRQRANPVYVRGSARSPQHNDALNMHEALYSDVELPTFDSLYRDISVVGKKKLDKPPSYDEAMASSAPNVPPLKKFAL